MALALYTSGLAHCSQRSPLVRNSNRLAAGTQRVTAPRPERVSQCYSLPACVVPHACMRMRGSSRQKDRGGTIWHLACL
jgi:hypothetical protein